MLASANPPAWGKVPSRGEARSQRQCSGNDSGLGTAHGIWEARCWKTVLIPEGRDPKRSRCCPPVMEYLSMTFYNPREKPVRVREMEPRLALSVYYSQATMEPPALSQIPQCTCALFLITRAFSSSTLLSIANSLSIIPWHWGQKLRATAQLQGVSSAVPHPNTMYR